VELYGVESSARESIGWANSDENAPGIKYAGRVIGTVSPRELWR
jgi:hypothetical protein